VSARVVCIHQPPFLPWLGIAESLLVCDVFVVYDDVQYEDGGVQNRNRIKTASGDAWLTVPVRKRFGQLVSEVAIADTFSPAKLLRTIEVNYASAPYFGAHFDELASVVGGSTWHRLIDLNVALLRLLRTTLGSTCDLITATELGVPVADKRNRLPAICTAAGCEWIYSGSGMRRYLPDSETVYANAGVGVIWHDYERRHAEYPQQFPRLGFVPCLSWIDMWFNCGAVAMRERLLASGRMLIDRAISHRRLGTRAAAG
jgi:hypothetical protein